jgi:GntR family transcriptional regulator
LEGLGVIGPFDDLDGQLQPLRRPRQQLPGVAAVGPGPADATTGALEVEQQRPAASRSCTDAGVTSTSSSSPVVSTAMCRLRPLTFLALSQPRLALGTVAAARTDWESMTAAVGSAARPVAWRARPRNMSCKEMQLGLLEPGDQLPTAQQVVAKLAINPNTVLKAYRDLEREGLVQPRPGQGSFITRSLPRTDPAAQTRFLGSIAPQVIHQRDHRAVGGIDLPHRLPLAVTAAARHPGAHHPGPLGHIDRGREPHHLDMFFGCLSTAVP